jgi:hypothetical protein
MTAGGKKGYSGFYFLGIEEKKMSLCWSGILQEADNYLLSHQFLIPDPVRCGIAQAFLAVFFVIGVVPFKEIHL